MREPTWLDRAMHAGFLLLLAASAARLVARHGIADETVPLTLGAAIAVVYVAGIVLRRGTAGVAVPLAVVVALWVVLVLLAPSFAWCAVPLYFLCLRYTSPPVTVAAAIVLTGAVVVGQIRIADVVDPSLILAPIGIAAMTTVVFAALERELVARQELIAELMSTRDSLAETERRAGVLAERQRLAREIHDTLAQGLTSIGLLLQAAQRTWDSDPNASMAHVARAADVAERGLGQARRFVDDLRPPELDDATLGDALRRTADEDHPIDVRFREEGPVRPLPQDVQATLLRVARQALDNAVEHSGGTAVVVTLSYLGDEVRLDVADDGRGMAASAGRSRGFGLTSMRERLERLGGSLDVETAPGDGTVVAARVPLKEAT